MYTLTGPEIGGWTAQGSAATGENVQALALEAVKSIPGCEAAELWIVAFRTLVSLSLPLDNLVQELVRTLSGTAKGPLRVSHL